MPRSGGGVYSAPSGTTAPWAGNKLLSTVFNLFKDDLVEDANAARPVVAGGTGATTAAAARTNLGVSASDATVTAIAALSFDATNAYMRATGADTFVAEAAAAHKTALSLNNVDNTSDATKNAAAVTLTNKTIDGGTSSAALQVSSETTGALTGAASRNKVVHCSGNITLPATGMTDGDVILIDPRGSARTVSRPAAHTMYMNDVDSASGTTSAHNIVTAMYHGSSKWTVQGAIT